MMRAKWLLAMIVVVVAGRVDAGFLTDSSTFSGSETVIGFEADSISNTVATGGVTIVNHTASQFISGWDFGGYYFGKPSINDPALIDLASQSDFSINFTDPVNRVGMLLSSNIASTWLLQAFDSSGTLLGDGSVTGSPIPVPPTGAPANTAFAGFEFTQAIARIRVYEASGNAQATILDDLRFEAVNASPVPEPASIALLAMGGVSLVGGAIRKRRRSSLS